MNQSRVVHTHVMMYLSRSFRRALSLVFICVLFPTAKCNDTQNTQRTSYGNNYGCNKNRIQCSKLYPEKHDRIAIIGAGPAGVHMAYKLQELEYMDITIFEKSDRIGGKSYTYSHKGTLHEMGSKYVESDYTEVFNLLTEFDAGSVIPDCKRAYWNDTQNFFLINEYPFYVVATEYGITDLGDAYIFLMNATQKYIALHRELFSEYEGELFPRPNDDVLYQTRGTFMDFLERHNITVLKSLFISTQTIQGYGNLDEISALYGLMWNNPAVIVSLIGKPERAGGLIEDGYQGLWEKIVREKKIKVIFNADIMKIRRRGKVTIRYKDMSDGCSTKKTSEFDFLIIAANIKGILSETVHDVTYREMEIFEKLEPTYFTVTLVDSEYGKRSISPVNYLIYDILTKNDYVVRGISDTYGIVKNYSGENYQNGLYPGNPYNEFIESATYYQHNDYPPSERILKSELDKHLSNFGIRNYTVIKTITWEYFPRFSPEDLTSGILWDILDLQGHMNTWYIGSSACFDSIKNVLEYNKLLLRKFNLN